MCSSDLDELQWVEFAERVRQQEQHREATGNFLTGSQTLARLEILLRDEFIAEVMLGPGRVVIGRTPDNDVQIRSKFVSRHHTQIVSDRTQSVVEDLNSTNGVFIRGQRVQHHTLTDGDVIQLGEHQLLYRNLRSVATSELVPVVDEDDDEPEDDGNLAERPFDEGEALEE